MSTTTKKTPLYGWHSSNGANMADFGGYEMPLWYSSAKNEHLTVLTHAGLFDTSHMAVVTVSGEDAFDLLQLCFTNDLSACIGPGKKPLVPGRCVYGAFLNESGGVIDDAIVFQMAAQEYMVVVNAGMGAGIATHLARHRDSRQAAIADLTDRVGKIDLQGPAAVAILQKVLADPDAVFEKMFYFTFKGHFQPDGPGAQTVKFKNGATAMISRTGYTGEVGFEIFCSPQSVEKLWLMIMEVGSANGLLPCGLAARDSLRAGAVLPLSHQDIGPWPFKDHPWPFALPFKSGSTEFSKPFIGAEALRNIPSIEYTRPFAGYDLRKVTASEPAVVMDADGKPMGQVLTCVTDMAIGRFEDDRIWSIASPERPAGMKLKGLCCGFVKVDRPLKTGQQVFLKDQRRTIKVEIVDDVRPDRTARKPLKDFR